MDCPEAVITPDLPEHLIVAPLDAEEGVVEEDFLEGVGVHHAPEVDTSEVVFPRGLDLGLGDVHVVEVAGEGVDDGDQDRRGVDQVHVPPDKIPQGGDGGGVERGAAPDVGYSDEHGGGALPVQQLDAAQQSRQELVHDPGLEAVPEVASKLIVDSDTVSRGREGGFLYPPEVLHAVYPN